MNVLKTAAAVANEGIWVILGWVVIGMFLFTTGLMIVGVLAWLLF